MEQRTKRLTQTVGAIGIATGLGIGAVGLASAATSPSTPAATAPSTNGDQTGQDQKDPSLNGSVQAPERRGVDEGGEAAALQSAAKITSDQAKQAALAAVRGTVKQVELDNENGSVVYSVEVSANGTTTDVKVDAGNGKVLAQESGQDDGKHERPERGNEKAGSEQPDANGQAG